MKVWNDNLEAAGENMAGGKEKEQGEELLLQQLFAAAGFKEDPENYRKIEIQRNGRLLFSFRVRPLEEEELQACRKNATQYGPHPQNRNISIEVNVDLVKLRSYKIYQATVEEDRKRIWDNKAFQQRVNVLQGVDTIDTLLLAGEKDRVCDIIDEISGFALSLEEYAKN